MKKNSLADKRGKFRALRDSFYRYWAGVASATRKPLWYWDMREPNNKREYGALAASVNAASKIGYDTHLEVNEAQDQLTVVFVKKSPSKPWEFSSREYDTL